MNNYIVLDKDIGSTELCFVIKEQEFEYVYDENENRRVRTIIPELGEQND